MAINKKTLWGLIILAIAAILAILMAGPLMMKWEYNNKVKKMIRPYPSETKALVLNKDFERFSPGTQRWLNLSRIASKWKIPVVEVEYHGSLRDKPGGEWVPYSSEDHYSLEPAGLIRLRKSTAFAGLKRWTSEGVLLGKAFHRRKLAGLIPLTDDHKFSKRLALVEYLGAMMWMPQIAMSSDVSWKVIDVHSTFVRVQQGDLIVSGVFYYGEMGKVEKFTSEPILLGDGRSVTISIVPLRWELHGDILIPVMAEWLLHLPEGDFPYMRLEGVDKVSYFGVDFGK